MTFDQAHSLGCALTSALATLASLVLVHVPHKVAHEERAHAQHERKDGQAQQPGVAGEDVSEDGQGALLVQLMCG